MLEEKCRKINEEISSIQSIIKAIQQNEFVTDVKEIHEGGKSVGYEIHFSESGPVILYHGKDGEDGHVPQLSVRQDTDGVWYWTVDGEWVLDGQGNKISTIGRDDLIPKMKIQDDYWYISYDDGETWTKLNEAVGENGADGADGTSFFKEISHDDEYVYVTLIDGTALKMPKASALDVVFDLSTDIPCTPGAVLQIPYTLSGVTGSVEIITICEGEWNAKVYKNTEIRGYVEVKAPAVIDDSKILVAVSDSRKTIMKTLTFVEGVFSVTDSFALSKNGGELSIDFSTNFDYTISADASWITSIETRAVRHEKIVISYEALPSGTATRTANLFFTNEYSGVIKTIKLVQGSPVMLSESNLNMVVGDEIQLKATSTLGHTDFLWFSSDSDMVRADSEGNIIALRQGTATITVMTSDFLYSATCVVSVSRLEDIIRTEFGQATNISYENGYVQKGTKLSWFIYNESTSSIKITALQLNDSATGYEGNLMNVDTWLAAGDYTGWTITLGTSYKSPCCKFYFTYNGKEYTQECASIFN